MIRNSFVIQAVLALALSSGLSAQTTKAAPIDYESLCKLDKSGPRRVAWMSTTPASRAETVRIQVERWRDANRPRLNPKQLENLEQVMAASTSTLYSEGTEGELARAKAQRLSKVTQSLFSPNDLRAMSVVDSPCISKAQ